jgi:hypothetical protein
LVFSYPMGSVGPFRMGTGAWCECDTDLHLLERSRTHVAIPPFPYTSLRRDV